MDQIIGIASDHGGRDLRLHISHYLKTLGYEVRDFGVEEGVAGSVDYPDYAGLLAESISSQKLTRGILVCGTGIGMSIAANKFPGVRAALVWDEYTAHMSRLHNNANILCLGARVLNHDRALDLVKVWLETPFEGSRHQSRLDKIEAIEEKLLKK
jgi:ribose 5-phosphate isomerase B